MGLSRKEKLERYFLDVIQDRRKGRFARILRSILRYLSFIYGSVMSARHFLYEKGIFRHHTLGCQVISIGNLTVGGTGKTPIVEVFARELQKAGRKVAILSRGYKKVEHGFWKKTLDTVTGREQRRPPRIVSNGRELLLDSAMSGDEPYMLASNLPDVIVLVDRDRVKSGRYAVDKFHCDTLVLDDGFQYRSLKHRAEIVLVDCTNPFSNGYILPRGLLRESVANLRRADFIFITKATGKDAEALVAKLHVLNPRAEISVCVHRPKYLQNVYSGERLDLDFLKGRNVSLVSGIASPEGFEKEIRRLGASLGYLKRFADHHRYTQQEIIDIINKSKQNNASAIITTEKDAVRFPKIERQDVPMYFLRVEIELLSGVEDFHACISRICFR
ncbi:MAG: tetraacyldisaccharide 4'-kinase [Kiritimatiellae bacterium]|nr:tetraacyldisaccharide 4'-kinase [Kiritimatiellia bacterium]